MVLHHRPTELLADLVQHLLYILLEVPEQILAEGEGRLVTQDLVYGASDDDQFFDELVLRNCVTAVTDVSRKLIAVAGEKYVDVAQLPGVHGVETLAERRLVLLTVELQHHLPPVSELRTLGLTVNGAGAEALVRVGDALGLGERDELHVHLRVVAP
ncbi:MAG: hypothetical protein A2725_00130 [Candidatus Magasanikbacteria bacterium RIFCSPHIGHO2_01_FULL_33_34]|uniref:Uncharacterized protein n=1 Tax=Candidatus Magasanikbacteria bacterium RIFCSPHIGHO2_01_FULL_33_34 TaxID=1798671 RepID=A0A1F6LL53_9BACT|nr:MAG: hypothetical protein A2725_00130 [Candidatus Magasanikbacteria bacterium RIFCSPHIGHO2_01_FULL_33_34]OGH65768.1 MAG: hypothetical protein A3B83_02800 [Candidatus Magasanikbacteria bacterium RIFCSPHIGHO2_02_FULL_33_17]OGH75133.1 MAG: hypothetical protein A3A89_03395 [Candidatus Magasanikbacteria bacterium RIFCSPLOWO2_01_FULL_33_34]OGH81211.1 MAG: hypothetical protein A3F93_04095 [Candidatus Magasanikbacteria bacterium RIFCSPLOWO2_12_FULL_34_7]